MLIFSALNVKNTRHTGIDLLRGVAILLVLFRHWTLDGFTSRLGWLGVDLFFVISGFLISGLLFREQQKHTTIDYLRFFVRRGLKIYPLFFLLIGASYLLIAVHESQAYTTYSLAWPCLHELLFIQNYLGGIYVHTWSLAVEEHFYIILMLCFALFFMKRKQNVLPVCIVFLVAPFGLRIYNCLAGNGHNHFFTHTRIDSLFCGVLLQYGWKYYREELLTFRKNMGLLLPFICVILLSCVGFISPDNYFIQGPGFTVIAFCFAGILLYVLGADVKETFPVKALAFTGFYSYSIYLLHIPVKLLLEYLGLYETGGLTNCLYFAIYVLSCLSAGTLASLLIEQPILRLRDKKFPSRA